MSTMILELQHVFKNYSLEGKDIPVLKDINIQVEEGATVAIVGPSGSGKSTLLGLCAGLDQASEGSIRLNGIELTGLSEDKLAQIRNEHVGFVFQNFQLLPTLTALENVMVPMELKEIGRASCREKWRCGWERGSQ